jgi:hypothetical protein
MEWHLLTRAEARRAQQKLENKPVQNSVTSHQGWDSQIVL